MLENVQCVNFGYRKEIALGSPHAPEMNENLNLVFIAQPQLPKGRDPDQLVFFPMIQG